MSTLQVRDVPEGVHRTLKARAAASGRSLSEYALDILAREARHPTLDELLDRVRARGPIDLGDSAQRILRAERDVA
jgi:plasmid stability protein